MKDGAGADGDICRPITTVPVRLVDDLRVPAGLGANGEFADGAPTERSGKHSPALAFHVGNFQCGGLVNDMRGALPAEFAIDYSGKIAGGRRKSGSRSKSETGRKFGKGRGEVSRSRTSAPP